MKFYDFSENDFGNEYMTEKDHVSVLKIFNRDGEIFLKMLVSNRKGRRIAFLVPSGEILQVKGYSDDATKVIIDCAIEIKDELIQGIEMYTGEKIMADKKQRKTAKDIPLVEFEKYVLKTFDSWWSEDMAATFHHKEMRYEYVISCLIANDRKEDIIVYVRKILDMYEERLLEIIKEEGEFSESAVNVMLSRAYVYYDEIVTSDCQDKDFYEEALKYSQKVLELCEKTECYLETVRAMEYVATGLEKVGRDEEANLMWDKVFERKKEIIPKVIAKYGEKDLETFVAMHSLADAYEDKELFEDSLKVWKQMYNFFVEKGNPETDNDYNNDGQVICRCIADILKKLKRYEEEVEYRKKSCQFNGDDWDYTYDNKNLAEALITCGRYKESVETFLKIFINDSNENYTILPREPLRIISRILNIYSKLEESEVEEIFQDAEIKKLRKKAIEIFEQKYFLYLKEYSESEELNGLQKKIIETYKNYNDEQEKSSDLLYRGIYLQIINTLANLYFLDKNFEDELTLRKEIWEDLKICKENISDADDYLEVLSNVADNFQRAGLAEESAVRKAMNESAPRTEENYWDY